MATNKELAAIEKRIAELQAANDSLRKQVAQATEREHREQWQEAVDSLKEEIASLRKIVQQGGEHTSFLGNVLKQIEGLEKVVFRTFVLGTTILGAKAMLIHEAAPPVEQRAPSQQEEDVDRYNKQRWSLGSGAEPLSKSHEKQRQEHEARFREITLSADEAPLLGFAMGPDAVVPQDAATEWFKLDKISEPNSVTNFIEALRNGKMKIEFKGGAHQPRPTFMPPPADPKKS